MAAAPAAGMGKGKRKRPLSEDDVYILLHRYTPATILTALQEVAQHAKGRRIDWKALVGKSTTGITSPREYQMLWRHFAYHHDLAESVDASSSPLDDDSDLECELEPIPNPSKEALSEASWLAKILIYGSSREQASGHRVNMEVLQNSANEKIVQVPSDKQLSQSQRLTTVMGLASNSKQASQTGPSPDPSDANGASKKKRKIKMWSKEEDADLAAGVQKYGEGNWEIILDKCNFRTTRTSDQLSQRWALISKRPGSAKPGTAKQVSITTSEERMATRKALSLAVDYNPCTRKLSAARSGAQQFSGQHNSTVFGAAIPEVKSVAAPFAAPRQAPVLAPMQMPVTMPLPVTVQVQAPLPQGQQAPPQAPPPKAPNASNKTRNNSKKQTVPQNPAMISSSIQAAAIAAGGRIATPTTAANHLKATQSKNAVHIRTRVTVSSTSSVGSKESNIVLEPRTQLGGVELLELPNTVASVSAPSILPTHATQQILDVSAADPPGPSSGEHFMYTKKALNASAVSASCNSWEQDDNSTFCIVTMADLFPEDANESESINPKEKRPEAIGPEEKQQDSVDLREKQLVSLGPKTKKPGATNPKIVGIIDSKDADMLEFDQFVASQRGASVSMDYLDTSNSVRSAPSTQGSAGSQNKQLKSVPTAGRSNSLCAGTSTFGKKTKSPVPHPVTLMPTGTPRVNVLALSSAKNKTVVRKAATPTTAGGQNLLMQKQALNTKGNQIPNSVAVSVTSVVPGSSPASTLVNAASKVNPPISSPASTVVDAAGKMNPPGSSQASTVVNAVGKANPPGRTPASPVIIALGKVNPPGNSQASTVVNGTSKANPAGSGKTSTMVNGGSKVNPLRSSQASKVVSGVTKANPLASQ